MGERMGSAGVLSCETTLRPVGRWASHKGRKSLDQAEIQCRCATDPVLALDLLQEFFVKLSM
jgi:hypothetical protein